MRTIVNKAADVDREVGRGVHEERPEEMRNFVRGTHVPSREVTVRRSAAIVRVVDVGQDGGDVRLDDGSSGGSGGVFLALALAEVVDELLCDRNIRIGRREGARLVGTTVGRLEWKVAATATLIGIEDLLLLLGQRRAALANVVAGRGGVGGTV
jgi:hypothetical protein